MLRPLVCRSGVTSVGPCVGVVCAGMRGLVFHRGSWPACPRPWTTGEQRRRVKHSKPCIAVVALSLVLFMLGHESAMAANPHPGTHATDAVPSESRPDGSCGRIEGVRPYADDVVGPDALAPDLLFAPALAVVTPVVAMAMRQWAEPDHPPGVRRALLQVYRN